MPFSRILTLCFWRENLNVVVITKDSLTFEKKVPLFFGLMFETCDIGGFSFESWSCSHFGTNILDKTENGSLLLEDSVKILDFT